MKIPQRNYFMFKKIFETYSINVKYSFKLEDFLKLYFNDIISKSKKKVYTIYFICLQYPELYESLEINKDSPLNNLSIFYINISTIILFFISFEPKKKKRKKKKR